ncbi:hypothetical protein Q9Q94_04375 [Uliginosibacterium sp. 31-16]|uniref:hypothetical protein n=1 Tax=Uliginosibacterium sp. 31-16 TaxID=3068315 RepID=UPI00273D5D25|nr:hypothetical protein [Uliginosibacterium sp. 31-16]MDP5238750.1 hypothetical protein [Uliginosibacterium sp. 31-16]
MNIDRRINKFRLASRELFNNYFLEEFLADEDWDFYEQFTTIEESLFQALVTAQSGIEEIIYGFPQPAIQVVARQGSSGMPIMLNREIDSGYWDHPIKQCVPGCVFTFKIFFDWDQRSYKDNRYVRAIVKTWPDNPSLVGKHVLIETHYVSYEQVTPEPASR